MSWHYGLVDLGDRIAICEVYDGRGHTDPIVFEAFAEDGEDPKQSIIWQLERALEDAKSRPIIKAGGE